MYRSIQKQATTEQRTQAVVPFQTSRLENRQGTPKRRFCTSIGGCSELQDLIQLTTTEAF
jgi:hypothetical protein